MPIEKPPAPVWIRKILELRKRLGVNQSQLAARINYSPMALSRWENGSHEPTAQGYVRLGNVAEGKDATWFWTRAGMNSADLARVIPAVPPKAHTSNRRIERAGSNSPLVTIPLLAVCAGAHGEQGDQVIDLDKAKHLEAIASPASWCPHPDATKGIHLRGSSMRPVIDDGDIIVVDTTPHDVEKLNGKFIVAWHRENGLTVSRFLNIQDLQFLEAESREYKPISITQDRNWRIVGKVLWWMRKAG